MCQSKEPTDEQITVALAAIRDSRGLIDSELNASTEVYADYAAPDFDGGSNLMLTMSLGDLVRSVIASLD